MHDDAPGVTLDQMGPTLYLVPDYEDPGEGSKIPVERGPLSP